MGQIKINLIKIIVRLMVFGMLFGMIFTIARPAYAAYSSDTLVSMTNSARAHEGLGSLTVNSQLSSAAMAKAQDMLANQYFSHTSPSGKTPWDFIKDAGYSYSYAGENLAIGYTDASELFTAWMNSSTHRANIINPNFREIGIAVISGTYEGQETMIVAQEFGTPQGSGEVASENSTPEPNSATPEPGAPSSSAPASQALKSFSFIQDKSSFNPRSIFAGEDVIFQVALTGDVQTLDVHIFDKNFNLLEAPNVIGSGNEKIYSITEKIDQVGSTDVTVKAKDKNGNEQDLVLGKLEVKQTTLSNQSTNASGQTWFAGFKEKVKNNWIGLVIFGGVLLALIGFLVFRKIKFTKLAKFGLSSWEF